MIQSIIEQLNKIENPISEKLVAINKNIQSEVGSNYYATTVFETYEKYAFEMQSFTMKLVGSNSKKLVETPLIFVRGGNTKPVWSSTKNQGIAFGATLVDYVSKQPLIVFVIDKDGENYSYKSIIFDITTKTYVTGESKNSSCSSINDLIDFAMLNANLDIDKFYKK